MITPTKIVTAFDSLVSETKSCELLKCQWGTTGSCVVGFRGNKESIKRFLTLFANFDFDDIDRIAPSPPHWLHESLAYLSMTNERLEKALKMFFHCEILRIGEVEVEHEIIDSDPANEDENAVLISNTSYDAERVEELAIGYAQKFVEEHIRVSSFMPPSPQNLNIEHSMGTMVPAYGGTTLSEVLTSLTS